MVRVLVCGGREWGATTELKTTDTADEEWEFTIQVLDSYHGAVGITEVIHGDARGADSIGGAWARQHKIKETKVPADWAGLGKRAGMVRNRQMARMKPDIVMAFPGGNGTAGMISIANETGLKVQCYELP